MFKNRIRTAAIAGIAALATGVSGTVVATPAFAQVQDGSNATDVEATDRYDLDLTRANEDVRDQIEAIERTEAYENAVVDREAFLAGEYDQSEEALIAEYEALREDVQAALAEAVANVDTAREGVLDAEAKDNAVRGALAGYGESAAALSNLLTDRNNTYTEVVPTLDENGNLVVDNTVGGLTAAEVLDRYIDSVSGGFNTVPRIAAEIDDLDGYGFTINGEIVSPTTDTNIVNFDDNVVQDNGNDGQVDSLQRGFTTITPSNNGQVEEVKDSLAEIEALRDAVAETDDFGRYVEGTYLYQIEEALEELDRLKTTLEAEGEDPVTVTPEEGIVDPGNDNPDESDIANPVDTRTSEAQAKKLENAEAYLEGLKAEIEGLVADLDAAEGVYNDAAWAATSANYASRSRALQDATSQRNALRGLDGYLGAAIKYTELYFDDVLTNNGTLRQQYYDVFRYTPFELRIDGNGDGEDFEREPQTGASEHVRVAVGSVIDGANIGTLDQMLNELSRLGLVEQAVADQAAADKQASDRDQAIIDNLTGSDESDDDNQGSIDDNIGGGSSFEAPSFGGGSSDLGGFGIAAVIAAIIGVLALVVPNIQNFL